MKESDEATMMQFIDNIKLIIATMSYDIFSHSPAKNDDVEYLYYKGNGASVKGHVSSKGFTVLKGSIISDHITPSFQIQGKSYYNLKMRLENDGTIYERVFQHDYEFNSPTAASAVIAGYGASGNEAWKNKDGIKLKDLSK